jgi:hypothetical protein
MLRHMPLSSRLGDLDKRVLRDRSTGAREEWGRRNGWSLFAGLGALLVAFAAWALAVDRPAMAGVPFAIGIGYLFFAGYLFVKRNRVGAVSRGRAARH